MLNDPHLKPVYIGYYTKLNLISAETKLRY